VASKARIDLEAKDNASAVFSKVQRSMGDLDKRAASLSSGLGGITKAFGATSLAGAGLATALVASIKSTADFNDAMGKAAQRAGVTTEAMSKLSYAARLSDVSSQELAKGLRKLGEEAAKGSKEFEALGIATQDSAGRLRSSDQLFSDVAERFAKMPDGIGKTNLAIKLFGDRLGPQLIPLLNSGAQGLKDMGDEAERFGQVVTDDAAKAAAEFNDNLARIQSNISGVARQMASELIPALARVTSELLEGARQADGFWNAIVTFGTINPFRSAESNLQTLRGELASLEAQLATPSRWRLNTKGLEADIERVRLQIQFLESRQPRSAGGGRGDDINPPFAIPRSDSPAPAAAAARSGRAAATARTSETERYLQGLQRQLESMDDLSAREQVLRDIGMGRLKDMTAAQREQLLAIADTIDARKEQQALEVERLAIIDQMRQAVIDEAAAVDAASASWENMLSALVADTAEEKTRRLIEQVKVLDEALIIGRISAEQHAEALAKITEAAPQLEKNKSLVDDLGLSFTSAFEDAIAQGRNLGEVLKGLEQDIIRIITRKLVTEPLGNFITGAIGSIIPGLKSFDGGGYTGPGSRIGGLDGKGGYLAMLHPNETVLDHTRGQRMPPSSVQNINITVPMPSNGRRETALQFGRDVARSLQTASMRNG
jgi:hypothetical protein